MASTMATNDGDEEVKVPALFMLVVSVTFLFMMALLFAVSALYFYANLANNLDLIYLRTPHPYPCDDRNERNERLRGS
jgi:hypothetical protein